MESIELQPGMEEIAPIKRTPEPEYMDEREEARVYAEADFNEVNQAFAARLLELVPADASLTALDLGVGPGDIPGRLFAARPSWRIIGLDASAAMLAFARADAERKCATEKLHYLVGDAKQLPFATGSMDLVISNSILHHVADPVLLWREAARVAKPGAPFLMRDLFRPESGERARAIVAAYAGAEPPLLQEEFYRSLLAAYTVDEVREQLSLAGIEGLQVAEVSDRHLDIYGTIRQGG